jgi:hypothetical protein
VVCLAKRMRGSCDRDRLDVGFVSDPTPAGVGFDPPNEAESTINFHRRASRCSGSPIELTFGVQLTTTSFHRVTRGTAEKGQPCVVLSGFTIELTFRALNSQRRSFSAQSRGMPRETAWPIAGDVLGCEILCMNDEVCRLTHVRFATTTPRMALNRL